MSLAKRFIRAGMLASAATLAIASYAQADVTISSDATANISCSGGICSPTATDAVLNVNDLEGYLASGNVEVTTTGSGVQANNIDVTAPFSWSSASVLTLDAYQSITVDAAVSAESLSGMTLTTNDGGSGGVLSFGSAGNVTFSDVSSSLSINGQAYTLVKSVKSLAKDISKNPKGHFALARSLDAKKDGTYTGSPVPTYFYGVFEGLGNSIAHLKIGDGHEAATGFFKFLYVRSVARDFGLDRIRVLSTGAAGGLAGGNLGQIINCHVSGSVKSVARRYGNPDVGGLVAQNGNTGQPGTIQGSWSTANVAAAHRPASAGGLVGTNYVGTIEDSFATGAVTFNSPEKDVITLGGLVGSNQSGGIIIQSFATGTVSDKAAKLGQGSSKGGGLTGENYGTIEASYAMGDLSNLRGDTNGDYGGLTGVNYGMIDQAYATGALSNDTGVQGGLIGYDGSSSGSLSYDYWDTDTSGITNPSQGAGYPAYDPGITGLTTDQLQSGLPSGFDPAVWAEDSNINNGLPYLIDNPPRK